MNLCIFISVQEKKNIVYIKFYYNWLKKNYTINSEVISYSWKNNKNATHQLKVNNSSQQKSRDVQENLEKFTKLKTFKVKTGF